MKLKNFIVACAIVFCLLYVFDIINIPKGLKGDQAKDYPNIESNVAFNKPAKPLPENGATVKYYQSQALAPLNIITQSSDSHYLIKVSDWKTKDLVLMVFIRSGETVNLFVPLGTYDLRYATGETWFGYEDLFGPATAYFKTDSMMEFKKSGNTYQGNTIELIPRANGNLQTSKINKNNF